MDGHGEKKALTFNITGGFAIAVKDWALPGDVEESFDSHSGR